MFIVYFYCFQKQKIERERLKLQQLQEMHQQTLQKLRHSMTSQDGGADALRMMARQEQEAIDAQQRIFDDLEFHQFEVRLWRHDIECFWPVPYSFVL